ncbi:sodium:solute symporter family protein [uncultured Cloacibacillus sp.]|uniref:sodium:solute symporter family protein n=1 Tax=uncultured Cloacibacillus sp. TaxID=889794 RepID=UPI0025D5E1C3|nr:sodium:solute symporter family protein [uncultured Cloacibacillus sp.]
MHELVHVPAMLYVVIAYLVVIMLVGGYFYSKEKKAGNNSHEEFLLAGRSLGKIVIIGTIFATYLGGGTVTGGGNSLAYEFGIWPSICFAIPPIISLSVLLLMSEKIRNSGCFTVAELLEKKFGSAARTISAAIIALSFISIVSFQYRGLGFVLSTTTGISVGACTVICAVVVIILAYSGGLKTVAITDAMSAFIMLLSIGLALPMLVSEVGGIEWIKSQATPTQLSFFGGQTFLGWLGAYLPLTLLTIGDQNFYQRINAAKDLKTARIGLIGCMIASVIIIPLIGCISFIGRLWFGANIQAGQSLIATSSLLPVLLGGFLLAGASAFIITTADSFLLSASSNFTMDIYLKVINPKATEKQQVFATRMFIAIAGVLALIILSFYPSILAVQYMSYTISGCAITPAVISVLVWPKVTKFGGIASMVCGTIATIIWEVLKYPYGIQTIYIALPISIVVLIVGSLCTQPKKDAAKA